MLGLLRGAGALMVLVWGLLWPLSVAVLDTHLFGLSYRGDATRYDPWTGTLSTSGNMSPGFGDTVAHYIHWRPLRRVEVDIFGGVLEEALSAARQIQERRFVTVVARGHCDYGCLMILMAGDERLARYDMSLKLGDDRSSEIKSSGPERARVLAERASRLRARGVPERLLAPSSTDPFAPDDSREVSAIDLARWGVLTGLIDADGRRVSLRDAEARLAGA